ncbi:DAK2 domain-containing protein [Actinotalea sp. K2]|uniref:DAK2 domain-containing protein n=1 Tax=Actinotalea sp. K2 TaxID=2939438 RepID=UPI002017907F|nr:DAK2 domain-containing protein [Actinotalea sp. K2]MCL3860538.1 DAK2 domain-containing protein [Actinotalea sp. K2]
MTELDARGCVVDATTLRQWSDLMVDLLDEQRYALDSLNVFPVADSDTGTNLLLTVVEAAAAVGRLPVTATVDELSVALTRGALVGARGNSGVIVSQYLGTLVPSLVRSSPLTADGVVAALGAASDAAHETVARPVEGTMLTVARAVWRGGAARVADARAAGADTAAPDVLGAGLDAGYVALDRTPDQLEALRRAGVLDAGAWGLLLLLDALARALGCPVPARAVATTGGRLALGPVGSGHATDRSHPCGDGEFEVMYLATGLPDVGGAAGTASATAAEPADAAPDLRRMLAAIGESVAVVGGRGLWQVHVHTDHARSAIEVAAAARIEHGTVHVRHLGSQAGVHGARRPVLGLVAVTTAPGLVEDLARAGAVVLLRREGSDVDHDDLRRAAQDTGAAHVLVLAAVGLVAGAAGGATPRPSGSAASPVLDVHEGLTEVQVVTGVATLASLTTAPEVVDGSDADRTAGGAPPATAVAVVDALRHSTTTALHDVLSRDVLLDADAQRQTEQMLAVTIDLMGRLADTGRSPELVTVVRGAGTEPRAVEGLRDRIGHDRPGVELLVLAGDQPGPHVVLGVE